MTSMVPVSSYKYETGCLESNSVVARELVPLLYVE